MNKINGVVNNNNGSSSSNSNNNGDSNDNNFNIDSESKKLHGCIDHIMQPRNFDDQRCNPLCNSVATISLKSLARLYLDSNWPCNSSATQDKNRCNFSTEKTDKKLHSDFVLKHGISIQKLRGFLDEDWDDYKDSFESLELWADLLFKNSLIRQGKAPDNFTDITHCNSCGDVYVPPALVNDGNVLGCPWCWNRKEGLTIPRVSL